MIIDSHVHVWVQQPEKYPWQPIGGYVPENEASVEMLLAVMDAAGVEGAVLVQPTPYGWDNSYLLDAAERYPDRFRCVCLVDPLDESRSAKLCNGWWMSTILQASASTGIFNLSRSGGRMSSPCVVEGWRANWQCRSACN